jgi:hypothetical protein
MLEAGICSTGRIASFFGLADAEVSLAEEVPQRVQIMPTDNRWTRPEQRAQGSASYVNSVIEDALRSAGLMR